MNQSRTLLFYMCSEEYGIDPYRFADLKPNTGLAEAVHRIAVAIAVLAKMPVSPSRKDYSEGYDFYTWDLQKLQRETTVREVPNPGIVFAIEEGAFGLDTASAAEIVKLRVESSEDETQRALLGPFLQSSLPGGESAKEVFRESVAAAPITLIVEVLAAVIGGLIVAYLVWYFGFQ